MSSNEFKGFYLKVDVLPEDKIVDSKIDIKVSVKTTKKTYQLLKAGVLVNKESLKPEKEETAEEKKEKEAEQALDSLKVNMKKVYSIPLLLSAFIISACKQETPNCSSSDAQKIIFDLMKEELRLSNPNLSSWSRVYDKISFKLNDIRTNKHDKELDNYLCVANLEGKISEQDIQSVLNDIRNEQQAEYEKTEIMLKNAFNEFSLKMDKREKEQISELENEYSSKKNSLSSDKNKAISDSEQKLLENENHYKRMSSQIELDAKNYKRAGASDKEVSESLERNKNELSNNYNHHKNRFNQERDDKVKNIEDNLSILEESYPQDINRVKIYYQQERDKYLSETKEQLDKMVREHEQAIEAYRNQYNSGIKAPVRYKIESSDNGKDFYVTIQ